MSHPAPAPDSRHPGLHVCPACSKPFVVPEQIVEMVGADRYLIELACTNCLWSEVAVHDDRSLEHLDRELDRATGALQDALRALVLADELERIDRFAAALRDELLLPEDF